MNDQPWDSEIVTVISPGQDDAVQVMTNIPFAVFPSRTLHLHLFRPGGDSPKPLVVWIQGCAFGAFGPQQPLGSAELLLDIARRGYVVATIEHRIIGEAIFPALIQDAKAAVRFLRAHAKEYGIDPAKVAAWGTSSGAYVASFLGTTGGMTLFDGEHNLGPSSAVQAVVDWYGPTDFLQMGGNHNDPGSSESLIVGGAIQENPDAVRRANPITYVGPGMPPFLIMHGTEDPLVPYSQSTLLYQALRASGQSASMVRVQNAGHGSGFYHSHILQIVYDFLDQHLGVSQGGESGV